jgi:hypothetical protein
MKNQHPVLRISKKIGESGEQADHGSRVFGDGEQSCRLGFMICMLCFGSAWRGCGMSWVGGMVGIAWMRMGTGILPSFLIWAGAGGFGFGFSTAGVLRLL